VKALPAKKIQHRTGVALWRQIADELRTQIANGVFEKDSLLPAEMDMAKHFGVNRHTVRAALASLAQEGIVQSRQGQGTIVLRRGRIIYPVGTRTRFSDGVGEQAKKTRGVLLNDAIVPADKEMADALDLSLDDKLLRLDTLSSADDRPLSRSTSWLEEARFVGIAEVYSSTGSLTKSLKEFGVDDYVRKSTTIEARNASAEDAKDLELSPGAIVLITRSINMTTDGKPFQFQVSRFAADRVSLQLNNEN